MIQLNVDDSSPSKEADFVYQLWGVVKISNLPETVFVRFFDKKGNTVRYVRLRVEEWTDAFPVEPSFLTED